MADDPRVFLDQHWPEMKRHAETGGPSAVCSYIESFTEPVQRRVLYFYARTGLVLQDWEGKELATPIAVARAGIAAMLREADAAEDEQTRITRRMNANAMSYDLAADLADCWPDDGFERRKEHFEAGLAAAEDCVSWRAQMGASQESQSAAHWVKGMHQLSLGDVEGATQSWERAVQDARGGASGEPLDLSGASPFLVILAAGYLGIARAAAGDAEGTALLANARGAFEQHVAAGGEQAEDATMGLDQLGNVARKYLPAD